MPQKTYTTEEAMKKLKIKTNATLMRRVLVAKIEPGKERIGQTRAFRNIYSESDIKKMAALDDPRQASK